MHFADLKLHIRLLIYDIVGNDVNYSFIGNDVNYSFDDDNDNSCYVTYFDETDNDLYKGYQAMSFAASVLGDLDALQYLKGIPENPIVPEQYEEPLDVDERDNIEGVCFFLAWQGHWKALKWAIAEGYP